MRPVLIVRTHQVNVYSQFEYKYTQCPFKDCSVADLKCIQYTYPTISCHCDRAASLEQPSPSPPKGRIITGKQKCGGIDM